MDVHNDALRPQTSTPPVIRISEIGEYIRHESCARRFKLETNGRAEARKLPFADRLFNTLDPVLSEEGRRREDEWAANLEAQLVVNLTGDRPIDEDQGNPDWETFIESLRDLPSGVDGYAREVKLEGKIGNFILRGRCDFLLLLWRDDKPLLRVVECKASRRDRTYHRIQVALYESLIKAQLALAPLEIGQTSYSHIPVEAVVARIDESTNANQDILRLQTTDLSMERADLETLLAPEGELARIEESDLDDLPYQINQKCDGCVFSVHCLPESALHRRLQLLNIPTSTVAALNDAGIRTIDDLMELELDSDQALQLKDDSRLDDPIALLKMKAQTRASTLPAGEQVEGSTSSSTYQVGALPNRPQNTLPEYEHSGQRLVRVYLVVDYDYTENRIGALTAHVTTSDGRLRTGWQPQTDSPAHSIPDPVVHEEIRDGDEWILRESARGTTVRSIKSSPWSGLYDVDTGAERQLIQNFLRDLIVAIAEENTANVDVDALLLHFYVWSKSEMTRLIEACSRCGSQLLAALRELLGCREGTEQLIYSSLQTDLDRRYAMGWTGRGLVVASSLSWFGRRYHWNRRVAGKIVQLDRVFRQDLFDFKTTLSVDQNGNWAKTDAPNALKTRFEIRSRFHDSLPAPYWRAAWQTLPTEAELHAFGADQKLVNSVQRYRETSKPGLLEGYLAARAHALRWLEEREQYKNKHIEKVALSVDEIQSFSLDINSTVDAAVDFLRLDHAVKITDWTADHLQTAEIRVSKGISLPIKNFFMDSDGILSANIIPEPYGMSLQTLQGKSAFAEGSMVRVHDHSGNPQIGQTVRQLHGRGHTVKIRSLNWDTGELTFDHIGGRAQRYVLHPSYPSAGDGLIYEYATLDESPSDFVAGQVERRLDSQRHSHAAEWFNPLSPKIAGQTLPADFLIEQYRQAVTDVVFANGHKLSDDQREAVLCGLGSRIQLLQGPPGTGKTQTTAVALLTRIASTCAIGDIVLVGAHTHTAIDNLLERVRDVSASVTESFRDNALVVPPLTLTKVTSRSADFNKAEYLDDVFAAKSIARRINNHRKSSVVVIGGTTNSLLKLAQELDGKNPWVKQGGLSARQLLVDEASMMVFPHFLALSSITTPDSQIMLAGDHRQLSPIVANDWENEDRPPSVLYQPYVSAYDAVKDLQQHKSVDSNQVVSSALNYTFRLPPVLVDLISRVYWQDAIDLQGRPASSNGPWPASAAGDQSALKSIWSRSNGLFLVLHDERSSKKSNEVEAAIVREIVESAPTGEEFESSIAVITPHRAQRALLNATLEGYSKVHRVDTVERFQGGERPTVIVSGTASDAGAIAQNAAFLLDLNRSNVAFSRAQRRLIVVCSRTLLEHIPADLEQYQSSMLWKSIRSVCNVSLGHITVNGYGANVLTYSDDKVQHVLTS